MVAPSRPADRPITETYRVIYRVDTGAIVAFETVWAEKGAELERREPASPHLDSIIQVIAAQAGPLAVLKVTAPPAGAMRVDLTTRTVVALR
jgi:hypothetical protein